MAELDQVPARAWVDREHDGNGRGEARERLDRRLEQGRVVDERRPVERDEAVVAGPQPQLLPGRRGAGGLDVREHRVDHRVPDEVRQREVDPLALEVVERALGVDEQDAADVVGDEPVVLLGHRPVVAPQAGLEMGDRDVELHRRERAGERRVDVAGDDDEVGLPVEQDPLDPDERPRRLLRVGARADAEEDVRLRQVELGEEDVRHVRVVVLAGVDEVELDLRGELAERAVHRRRLHEVRARADDEADPCSPCRHRGGAYRGRRRGLDSRACSP